ncbi:protamine-like protein 99C isoform X2 [Drosophila subpulchrella]|uniref:protamine-like protein 99C isoform X2 n=1 Tax=Drosophila subpulchrella TaxID=1486046 RepID=UPI0018A19559|nr:protamine-like protein 99C isoform X2 [Drosophila subpulchrella]
MDGKKRRNALQNRVYNLQKVARVTNNGYLNFLREYKKAHCGVSPKDMVRFGARQWNQLTLDDKEFYKNMDPVTVTQSAPQESENQSQGENPGKSERVKCSQVRSPSARERKSKNKKKGKPSKSKCIKKRPSLVLKTLDPSRLGSAVAYMHFMRKFQKKNKNLKANDLLNKGTRLWCRLHGSQRQQYESPLWVVRTG